MPPGEKEHLILSDGLQLKGYSYEPSGGRKRPLLILCHGIPAAAPPPDADEKGKPEQKNVDGGYPALARRCSEDGFAVFHFNFRGTGESGGNFDLAGWRRDLAAVISYLEREKGEHSFILWGFSAGAAVSCCVCTRNPKVEGLIMAASPAEFYSIFPSQGGLHFLGIVRQRGIIRDPFFPPDPAAWLRQIYAASPLFHISAVAPRPLLIIHGSQDELIPLRHAFQLYRQAGPGAELVIQPAARHQLRRHLPCVERSLRWLNKKF